jgi:signal-transduction protein with cAMP-binding, CBS, and nucleotidyltransferase domain
MNSFIETIKKFGNISESVESDILKNIKTENKKKGHYLIKAGQSTANLFVLQTGLVRGFYIKNDKEINTWFASENIVLGSALPLFSNHPSKENIQLLEDSIFHYISNQNLQELYKKYPDFNTIGRKIAEDYCLLLEDRIASLQVDSAEDRYRNLINDFPNILQRVSLGHISSYLGITQATLSRIRGKV